MAHVRSQSNYQVRLGWGSTALRELAAAEVIVVVDALESAHHGVGAVSEDDVDKASDALVWNADLLTGGTDALAEAAAGR